MRIGSQVWTTLCVGAIAAVAAVLFHDYLWWPADDGVFGFWAEAVLDGKLIGRDFYEIHGGYLTFLNALLFKGFGIDAVVLRYPLIILSAGQAMMVAWLLRAQGGVVMVVGGLLSVTLGFIAAPNPSPVWYALFLAVSVIFVLTEFRSRPRTFLFVGLLIGLCFMIRHPNAIFLGMGVLAYLLHRSRSDDAGRYDAVARILIFTTAGLLLVYAYLVFEPVAFIIFAVPPLAFLWLLFRGRKFADGWVHPFLFIVAGAMAVVLPMVLFQLWHGNLIGWLQTSYFSSSDINSLPFFHETTYWQTVTEQFWNLSLSAWAFTACVFILTAVLVFAPLLAGCFAVVRSGAARLSPLLIIAIFYGMVSFYYQTVFYLFGSMVLFFLAMLEALPESGWQRKLGIGVGVFVAGWSFLLYTQGVVALVFEDAYVDSEIPRSSISYEAYYDNLPEVFALTERYSDVGDAVFAYPQEPYFYFNLERENPFPFPGTSRFVVTEAELFELQTALQERPPALIIHNQGNKYNGPVDGRLTEWIVGQEIFVEMPGTDDFRFFRRADAENLLSSPDATNSNSD